MKVTIYKIKAQENPIMYKVTQTSPVKTTMTLMQKLETNIFFYVYMYLWTPPPLPKLQQYENPKRELSRWKQIKFHCTKTIKEFLAFYNLITLLTHAVPSLCSMCTLITTDKLCLYKYICNVRYT